MLCINVYPFLLSEGKRARHVMVLTTLIPNPSPSKGEGSDKCCVLMSTRSFSLKEKGRDSVMVLTLIQSFSLNGEGNERR